jgi:riboflavin kinase/FMN adenylyltransferase
MKTMTVTPGSGKILDASIITIGNFDGVHRGHADIFAHLKQTSIAMGVPAVVVTFEPHPLKVLAPNAAPVLITTFAQKEQLISQFDIDYLVVLPFSPELSALSAADFVRDILCGSLSMRHIIIGHDYAFGRDRAGNFQTLQELSNPYDFTLEDVAPVGENDVIFSSSLVRSAVSNGDVGQAAQILGRYLQVAGTVVHGREIGHTLGFPTANIETVNELFPADGVYAVLVDVAGTVVKGACNIGFNPTVHGTRRTIEVFLLDFEGDLYGQKVVLRFVKRLRSVQKFASLDELKLAIGHDVAETRSILENLS